MTPKWHSTFCAQHAGNSVVSVLTDVSTQPPVPSGHRNYSPVVAFGLAPDATNRCLPAVANSPVQTLIMYAKLYNGPI